MNLWAKSLGRPVLFAVALFFFSCEEESSFLGFKNPTPKFNVTHVELPLTTSVFSIDSIITDNKSSANSVLIGQYQDPQLGNVRAESYVQIFPTGSTKIPADAILDSVTVQFRLNFYGYGFTGEQQQAFSIHEITEDSLSYFSVPAKRYWFSDEFGYDQTPLAEASVTVRYDSLKKQMGIATSSQDTLLATARMPETFASRIFSLAKTNEYTTNETRKSFLHQVKGFALVPDGMEGVLGFRILDGLSRLTIYYRTFENSAVKDTLSRNYVFSHASFSNISVDRSGTELAGLIQPFQSIEPSSGLRYVQSGSPVVTKLDLGRFYEFADQDSNRNIVINSAELVIDDVMSASGTDPHTGFVLKVMKNTGDLFAHERVNEDSIAVRPYFVIAGGHYFAQTDDPSKDPRYVSLDYDSDDGQYRAFMTPFAQSLFNNRNSGDNINENRIRFLAVYPYVPSVFTSVTRTVFNANSVKLKINYTRPSGANP